MVAQYKRRQLPEAAFPQKSLPHSGGNTTSTRGGRCFVHFPADSNHNALKLSLRRFA